MYQVKLSEGYEVVVIGSLCRVIDSNGYQKFSGNHDKVAQYCELHHLKGWGPAPDSPADCTVTGVEVGDSVRLMGSGTRGLHDMVGKVQWTKARNQLEAQWPIGVLWSDGSLGQLPAASLTIT